MPVFLNFSQQTRLFSFAQATRAPRINLTGYNTATAQIDYIAVDNRLRREVEDAKVVRGLLSDSDHFAVVAKVRMRERWELKGNGRKEGRSGRRVKEK